MKKIFIVLTLILLISSAASGETKQLLPKYKITAKAERAFSVLVDKNTTKEQLRDLIFAFKNARNQGTLHVMGIPPTTPNGSKGDYAIVGIYVFTNKESASQKSLDNAFKVSSQGSFSERFNKNIKAYYYFGILSSSEEGSIGYAEHGRHYTKDYEKLF